MDCYLRCLGKWLLEVTDSNNNNKNNNNNNNNNNNDNNNNTELIDNEYG